MQSQLRQLKLLQPLLQQRPSNQQSLQIVSRSTIFSSLQHHEKNCDLKFIILNRYFWLYIITATIVCDFVDDWCNFGITTNGDDNSKRGFGWMRKTPTEIENQNLEGPDKSKELNSSDKYQFC